MGVSMNEFNTYLNPLWTSCCNVLSTKKKTTPVLFLLLLYKYLLCTNVRFDDYAFNKRDQFIKKICNIWTDYQLGLLFTYLFAFNYGLSVGAAVYLFV